MKSKFGSNNPALFLISLTILVLTLSISVTQLPVPTLLVSVGLNSTIITRDSYEVNLTNSSSHSAFRPPTPSPPPSRVLLMPTRGAVVYWPQRWPEQSNIGPASANRPPTAMLENSNVSSFWRLELVQSAVPINLHRPSGDDFFLTELGPRSKYCTGCDGTFELVRLVGCPETARSKCAESSGVSCSRPPLFDGVSNATIADAQLLGPDEFSFVLEGPEYLILHGTHMGDCKYSFPYSLTIPGLYRVFVLAIHADWDAVADTEPFPGLTLDRPVGDELFYSFGDPTFTEHARSLVLTAPSSTHNVKVPCFEPSPAGRWVFASPDAPTMFSRTPAVPIYPEWAFPPQIALYTDLSRDLIYLPYRCRWPLDLYAIESVRKCLVGKSLLFKGDSQMRVLFNEFMRNALRVPQAAVKGVTSPFCVDGIRKDNIEVNKLEGMVTPFFSCIGDDPFLSSTSMRSGNPLEPHPFAVIVNAGQHFAAASRFVNKLSALGYEHQLEQYFFEDTFISEAHARGLEGVSSFRGVVWVDTFPLPIRNDRHIHQHRDGRSHHRMELFNRIAERSLEKMVRRQLQPGTAQARPVMGFLRGFETLLPLLPIFPDQSHAEGTQALTPLSHGLFHLFCMGNVGFENATLKTTKQYHDEARASWSVRT
jgi:hypothetical protein